MKRKKRMIWLPVIIVALSAAAFAYSRTDSGYEALVAVEDIAKGTVIDEGNINKLFRKRSVPEYMVSDSLITDTENINGKKAVIDIAKNTPMQSGFVEDKKYMVDTMKYPVTMGIKAADISEIVCGKLRSGDFIDISVIEHDSGKCDEVINNVYVAGCYSTDGTLITGEEESALSVNIIVEKEDEQHINEMLAKGSVKICKVGG